MQTVRPFGSFDAAADPERVGAGQVRASLVLFALGTAMMPGTGQAHLSRPTEDFDAETLGESAGA